MHQTDNTSDTHFITRIYPAYMTTNTKLSHLTKRKKDDKDKMIIIIKRISRIF